MGRQAEWRRAKVRMQRCIMLSRWAGGLALAVVLLPITACSNFFQCSKASCPTTPGSGSGGSTGSTTANYAYVANSSAGTTYLSEYSVGSNALNSLGTVQLGYIPEAMAVSPNNSFLYVASVPGTTSPGIYLYTIGSTGVLTAANNGSVLAPDTVSSMAISPDGKWMFTVNVNGTTMAEYGVDPSTGKLTLQANLGLQGTPCTLSLAVPTSQSCSVTVAQSGNYVVAALGISGDVVYPFNSTNGVTITGAFSIPSGYPSVASGDFAVAVNGSNYAYIAQTNSVAAYVLQTGGYSSPSTVPYPSGSAPRSIVLNPAGTYVYTANEAASTISGFSVVNGGGLKEVSGSPVKGPANVSAISVDSTGGYLLAVGYDASAGVQMYTISSAGVLAPVAQRGSGTNEAYPALVAMTH